jgi:S1-C subfamily serine protease
LALMIAHLGCHAETPAGRKTGSDGATPLAPEALPAFDEVFERVSRSVVNVSATHELWLPDSLRSRRERESWRARVRSLGSGFVLDRAGHIVTCSSVVEDAESIEVSLWNGRRVPARLAGSDDVTDLAILEVAPDLGLEPLAIGPAARPGDWVASFGYPYGMAHSISAGMVSLVRPADALQSLHGLILSDAAVNPGCNGGPLVDTAARVVGINLIGGQGEGGLGMAIPIEDARAIFEPMLRGERRRHAFLGLAAQKIDARLALSFGLNRPEGALVTRVIPGGPAERAGVRPGDAILSLGKQPVTDAAGLQIMARRLPPDRPVVLKIWREGKPLSLTLSPPLAEPPP